MSSIIYSKTNTSNWARMMSAHTKLTTIFVSGAFNRITRKSGYAVNEFPSSTNIHSVFLYKENYNSIIFLPVIQAS